MPPKESSSHIVSQNSDESTSQTASSAANLGDKIKGYTYVASAASADAKEKEAQYVNANRQTDRRKRQLTPEPSPSKKRRRGQGACSRHDTHAKYAHLPALNDVLAPDLLVLFIGLNPGVTTAQTGHAYAHKSNLFWKLLHSSGLTDRRCSPEEDVVMPERYSYGFTNIVSRPTKDGSELSKAEMVEGTPVLEAKAREWKPEVCCLVGKGIWEAVWKWRHGRALSKTEFKYGFQEESSNMGISEEFAGARVFVAASTSGASASLRPAEKEAIWKPLGDYVKAQRNRCSRIDGSKDD